MIISLVDQSDQSCMFAFPDVAESSCEENDMTRHGMSHGFSLFDWIRR